MGPKTFSKKEAFKHAMGMVNKYFGTILTISFIYIFFEAVNGQLQHAAGSDYVSQTNIEKLYGHTDNAKIFKSYLVNDGYIDAYGKKQEKVDDLTNSSELALPKALERDRYKIYYFLQTYRYRLPFPKPIYDVIMLVLWVVGLIMSIGVTKVSLMVSRDQKPQLSDLFTNASFLISYLISGLCYALAVIGGTILLIVPGVIFAIALGLNIFFIVDQNMGPLQALKASRALTKGVRWKLFCFYFLLILFNLAGFLCILVGLFFTIPASGVAVAYVYDQLRKQNETAGPG